MNLTKNLKNLSSKTEAFSKKYDFITILPQILFRMRKSWLILTVFVVILACKKEAEKIVGTNENGEKLVINEAGDTIVWSETDSLKIQENPVEEPLTALTKNEDESYTFRYNLKKGETYPFLLKTKQEQSMQSNGQSLNLTSERTVEFDYFVEDVSKNIFKLKATFNGFSEKFKGPNGQTMSYDTKAAKPADKDVAQSWTIYKSIIGQSFMMEVDNKGKVISVNGLNSVISNALSKLKSEFNSEEQNMIKDLLNASLNNEAIKSQFEESLNIFPEKNMKIGEQWSDSQNLSEGPVKGTNKVTRTFKSLENGKAKITVDGTQNVNSNETKQGITMNMNAKSTINGYVDLDMETGWIRKESITKKESINTTYQKGTEKESESGTSTTVTTVN